MPELTKFGCDDIVKVVAGVPSEIPLDWDGSANEKSVEIEKAPRMDVVGLFRHHPGLRSKTRHLGTLRIPVGKAGGSFPWSRKCQPIALEAKRFFYKRFPPQISGQAYAQIDAFALRRSVQEGANWLLSVQEPSGHFKYWYDPASNQFSPSSEDSFHRQAGAAMGSPWLIA